MEKITHKDVVRAFEIFCKENNIKISAKWLTDKGKHSNRYLKLDKNFCYGGYRLDWVNPNTSESFFTTATRRNTREMHAYLWGLIDGTRHSFKEV